ncbi:MAG: trypsin-like peptidase domain-containing protein [Candidatus Saccharimonas sp.]
MKTARTMGSKTKPIKVTHAHKKPYRKRHYIALIASIALAIALLNSALLYQASTDYRQHAASQTIADLFSLRSTNAKKAIASTYGFTVRYNPGRYYASAIDSNTGDLFTDAELDTHRAYETIKLSEQTTKVGEGASIKLAYYPAAKVAGSDLAQLEKSYVVEKQVNPNGLVKGASKPMVIRDVSFLRTEWSRNVTVAGKQLKTSLVTYIGIVHNSPFVAVINNGLFADNSTSEQIMADLEFSDRIQAYVEPTVAAQSARNVSDQLIDTLLMSQPASAAGKEPAYTASERISATYSPAVVKIYNIFIADIMYQGSVVAEKRMNGSTGSGFLISSDGYIASNGHVVANSAREELITIAIEDAAKGDTTLLNGLITEAGVTAGDLEIAKTGKEQGAIIIQKIYDNLAESRFSFKNMTSNLLVGMGEKQVDLQDLIKQTQAGERYAEQPTIKRATFKAADYDGIILPTYTGKFTKSDVALIKLDGGSNFPMTTLGSMSDIAQGANINIMGYPGIGSSNGLVSETKTAATLTTGKVSAHKDDNNGKKMIETDTEIGHGNSGGPAFDDSGNVIGVATYGTTEGANGGGKLNYVRNIKDLTDLADKSSVRYSQKSETQKTWEAGINDFYRARYKKAVKSFQKVKTLYPDHPRVNEMIATAEKRIAAGENIDDFPWVLVLIGGGIVAVLAAAATTFIIIRHKKTHAAYTAGVASGTMQPIATGAPAQYIVPAVAAPLGAAPVELSPSPVTQSHITPQDLVSPMSLPAPTSSSQPAQPPAVATQQPVSGVPPTDSQFPQV